MLTTASEYHHHYDHDHEDDDANEDANDDYDYVLFHGHLQGGILCVSHRRRSPSGPA